MLKIPVIIAIKTFKQMEFSNLLTKSPKNPGHPFHLFSSLYLDDQHHTKSYIDHYLSFLLSTLQKWSISRSILEGGALLGYSPETPLRRRGGYFAAAEQLESWRSSDPLTFHNVERGRH